MKHFKNNKNHHGIYSLIGQSAVEYLLMLLLVVAAILIMRPIIVRSWHAQQKGWDDSVRDSINDPLSKTTLTVNAGCVNCAEIPPCSIPPCCGYDTCSDTQEAIQFSCPEGTTDCPSNGTITCISSASCCSKPIPLGDDTSCPEGGMLASYTCGGSSELQIKCVAKEDVTCRTGDWTPWIAPPPATDGWSHFGMTKFRYRECLDPEDPNRLICTDCLCEEYDDGMKTTFKITTTDPEAFDETPAPAE